MTPERAADYLDHMIQAIDRIGAYTEALTHENFLGNSLVQDAVIRNIEIIGEAARNFLRLAEEVALEHPEIPWRSITGMRNQLTHGYSNVDIEAVWATVRDDLPPLCQSLLALRQRQAARYLAKLGGSEPDLPDVPRRRPWEE
jgi:uncharacterized protein with HEPN domain